MPTHSLTQSQNGTRVKLQVSGSSPTNVIVGDPSQAWSPGCVIEVVSDAPESLISFHPFDVSVTLNILSGTNTIRFGEHARLCLVSPGVWDLTVFISAARIAGGTISVSGDAAGFTNFTIGPTNTNIELTLTDTGVDADEYGAAGKTVTLQIDSKGRIVSASEQDLSVAESQIVDGAILARVSDNETITGTWDFNNPVTVAAPTNDNHAATKLYVDTVAQGHVNVAGDTMSGSLVLLGDSQLLRPTASTTGGYPGLRIDNSQGAKVVDILSIGSSALPLYGAQPGSAVISTGAGIPLNIATGNAVRMHITADGNIGVGTSSPAYRLDVAGPGRFVSNDGTPLSIASSSQNSSFTIANPQNTLVLGSRTSADPEGALTYLYTGNNVPMAFSTNAIERMRISAGGNIGIGTTDPQHVLHIQRSSATASVVAQVTGNAASDAGGLVAIAGQFSLVQAVTGDGSASIVSNPASSLRIGTTSSSSVTIFTNNTDRVRIDAGGRVGIGTVPIVSTAFIQTPGDITLSNSSAGALQFNSYYDTAWRNHNSGFGAAIRFEPSVGTFQFMLSSASTDAGEISTIIERVSITANGDVGIGTTSPVAKLDVLGDGKFIGNVSAADPSLAGHLATKRYVDDIAQDLESMMPVGQATTQRFVASAGQTVFTLTNQYAQGANTLAVYLNGALQSVGVDYTETSPASFTFSEGLNAGDVVVTRVITVYPGASSTSSLVAHTQPSSGAVNRSVFAKLNEVVSVKDFGANGDGSTDDSDAIIDAVAAVSSTGGTVYMPRGTYPYSVEIVVPPYVNIVGEGKDATTLKSIGSNARLYFANGSFDGRGGESGGFELDGNNIGTDLLKLGLAVERSFRDIHVHKSATNGIVLNGTQNTNWFGVDSQQNFNTNIVFDYGAGNNRWFGSEVNRAGNRNIAFLASGIPPVLGDAGAFPEPTGNTFIGAVIERLGWTGTAIGDPDTGSCLVYHGAGRFNTFRDCSFALPGLDGATKPLILVLKAGAEDSTLLTLSNCYYSGTVARTTAIEVRAGCTVVLDGRQNFESHANALSVADTGLITGQWVPTVGAVTSYFANQGGGTQPQQNLLGGRQRQRMRVQVPTGQVAMSVGTDTDVFDGVEIYQNAVQLGNNTTAADQRIGKVSRHGIDGVEINGTSNPSIFCLKLGSIDLLVLNFAPSQNAPNGSVCFRTDNGKLYVRESGVWVMK